MNLFSLWFYLKYVLSYYLWGWNLEGFLNKLYVLQSHKKDSPSSTAFQTVYSYSFLVFLNAIASPQPMKGGQFSEWIPAGKGIISPPTSRDLYWVSLTRLSWQPSFVIVPQLGASFRELPALSSGSHPQFLRAGRKASCCKGPAPEPPLQRWIPAASEAERCHSQG